MSGLNELLAAWRNTGRVAHHYPRKHLVSLNGGRAVSEKEAADKIKEFLNRTGAKL
jgi:hypothetical protein